MRFGVQIQDDDGVWYSVAEGLTLAEAEAKASSGRWQEHGPVRIVQESPAVLSND